MYKIFFFVKIKTITIFAFLLLLTLPALHSFVREPGEKASLEGQRKDRAYLGKPPVTLLVGKECPMNCQRNRLLR